MLPCPPAACARPGAPPALSAAPGAPPAARQPPTPSRCHRGRPAGWRGQRGRARGRQACRPVAVTAPALPQRRAAGGPGEAGSQQARGWGRAMPAGMQAQHCTGGAAGTQPNGTGPTSAAAPMVWAVCDSATASRTSSPAASSPAAAAAAAAAWRRRLGRVGSNVTVLGSCLELPERAVRPLQGPGRADAIRASCGTLPRPCCVPKTTCKRSMPAIGRVMAAKRAPPGSPCHHGTARAPRWLLSGDQRCCAISRLSAAAPGAAALPATAVAGPRLPRLPRCPP